MLVDHGLELIVLTGARTGRWGDTQSRRYGSTTVEAPSRSRGVGRRRALPRVLGGIASQAKLAISNALASRLERTFLSTVEALANALEAKDEYTHSHARWITDMSLRVGPELGLDAGALKRLELGALFHDIGKIGIPASSCSSRAG